MGFHEPTGILHDKTVKFDWYLQLMISVVAPDAILGFFTFWLFGRNYFSCEMTT